MPSTSSSKADDRVFVRNGRRHYRRTYSTTEFRVGLAIVAALFALLSWIAWKGAHPDPELFRTDIPLLASGEQPVAEASRGAMGTLTGRSEGGRGSSEVDRGPLPTGLAAVGWYEGPASHFGPENLYEKINGREGYYKAFGFEGLHFVSLAREGDPGSIVDVELFDLGNAANALGAYAGERSQDIVPEIDEAGMTHIDRNALFLTRGRYYLRAIGSAETPVIHDQLVHLRRVFQTEVEGEALPWGFALFVGKLGMGTERISFMPENAFSFGFATDVYAALLDDDETELFVAARQTPAEAEALARQFTDGFSNFGSPAGETAGVPWTQDRYISTIAGAKSYGSWVIGVRGAPDVAAAEAGIARLMDAVADLPSPEAPAGAVTPDAESSGGYDGEDTGGDTGYDGEDTDGDTGYDGEDAGGSTGYDGEDADGDSGYDGGDTSGDTGYDGRNDGGSDAYDGDVNDSDR